jgi:hypothetical protein
MNTAMRERPWLRVCTGVLAAGGIAVSSLGSATGVAQAAPAPAPTYHWCPGQQWNPGWGNNWDWNNCHDWEDNNNPAGWGPPPPWAPPPPPPPPWAPWVHVMWNPGANHWGYWNNGMWMPV